MVAFNILDEAVRRLVEAIHPQRIILFGSRARGTDDAGSDVDLLVICPIRGDRLEMELAMERSLRGMRLARDLVLMSPEEFERERHIPGTIARPATQDGKVLYDTAS